MEKSKSQKSQPPSAKSDPSAEAHWWKQRASNLQRSLVTLRADLQRAEEAANEAEIIRKDLEKAK